MTDSDLFKGLTDEEKKVAEAAASGTKSSSSTRRKSAAGSSKRSNDSSPGTTSVPGRDKLTPKWNALHKRIASLYVSAGMVLMMADDVTGQVFIQNADDRAYEWIELAQQEPSVERVLNTITQGGAWGSVLMGNATMVLAILARFNVLGVANEPVSKFTGVPVHPNFDKTVSVDPQANGAGN